jgi:hypothetical protein
MRGAIMPSLIFSFVLSFVSRQKKEQHQLKKGPKTKTNCLLENPAKFFIKRTVL